MRLDQTDQFAVMTMGFQDSGDRPALVKPERHVQHLVDLDQCFSIFLTTLNPFG